MKKNLCIDFTIDLLYEQTFFNFFFFFANVRSVEAFLV